MVNIHVNKDYIIVVLRLRRHGQQLAIAALLPPLNTKCKHCSNRTNTRMNLICCINKAILGNNKLAKTHNQTVVR